MQLFVSRPFLDGKTFFLEEDRVVKYIGRVLRMKPGDTCFVQWEEGGTTQRWEVILDTITKKHIQGHILDCKIFVKKESIVSLIVALPNKFSKLELIVQKLTEVGVDHIVLRPAQRSLLKIISSPRMERLQSIILESVEQCKRWTMPNLSFVQDITSILIDKEVVVFDFDRGNDAITYTKNIVGIVGPEGHFGEKDYDLFNQVTHTKKSLGGHILRTETAAIVGARGLCNGLL